MAKTAAPKQFTVSKRLLFSVSRDDCDWDTFRCPGKGGQNVNKVESGVRCTHRASGAIGKSCEERDQYRNRRIAFQRMAATSVFKAWHQIESARWLGQKSIDQIVDNAMLPYNLRVEAHTDAGWEIFADE